MADRYAIFLVKMSDAQEAWEDAVEDALSFGVQTFGETGFACLTVGRQQPGQDFGGRDAQPATARGMGDEEP